MNGKLVLSHRSLTLMPETFFPASWPWLPAVSAFFTLCASTINSAGWAVAPEFLAGCAQLIFLT